jgi:hypothetical protein
VNETLSIIADQREGYARDARTPFQISSLFGLIAALTWFFGGGAASLVPILAGGVALILALEARSSAEGISAAEHLILRHFTQTGTQIEWLPDKLHVKLDEDLGLAIRSLARLSQDFDSQVEGVISNNGDGERPIADRHEILSFSAVLVEGATRFRHHSIYNVGLVLAQRPGARAVGTKEQWTALGRDLCADAIPIIILKRFGPVAFLYEVEDTLPPYDRHLIGDPFGVSGEFNRDWLTRLERSLESQKYFAIPVRRSRTGFSQVGTAAVEGELPVQGNLALAPHPSRSEWVGGGIPSWRVTISDRMSSSEQFVTLCHELGHIFCGHLGRCVGHQQGEQSGWPDRHELSSAAKEIEAETVAWIIAQRASLETGSEQYINQYAGMVDPAEMDREMIILAANRNERFAGIRYISAHPEHAEYLREQRSMS